MAIECGVITALLVVIVIVFFRKKRPDWAWATLPITLLPFVDFCMEFVLVKMFHMEITLFAGILTLLMAVAASCGWIGFASGNLKSKRTKATYIGISNVFNVLLAAILIHNMLVGAEGVDPSVALL